MTARERGGEVQSLGLAWRRLEFSLASARPSSQGSTKHIGGKNSPICLELRLLGLRPKEMRKILEILKESTDTESIARFKAPGFEGRGSTIFGLWDIQ